MSKSLPDSRGGSQKKQSGSKHNHCSMTFCTNNLEWYQSSWPKKQASSLNFFLATRHILTRLTETFSKSQISVRMTTPLGSSYTTIQIEKKTNPADCKLWQLFSLFLLSFCFKSLYSPREGGFLVCARTFSYKPQVLPKR